MNANQVQQYVMRYLETTNCQIIEKAPTHVTVKLSPEADKDLTNRPYYWGFVERTGAPPETMSFTFVFDPEAMPPPPPPTVGYPRPAAAEAPASGGGGPQAAPAGGPASTGGGPAPTPPGAPAAPGSPPQDSILGRYLGVTPTVVVTGPGRIPRDNVTYGSRRLEQLFGVTLQRGRYVRQFEDVLPTPNQPYKSIPYTTWLGVNYKLELMCDMKRDELHSLGIDLVTGEIRERFMDELLARKLTPRLPAGIYVQPSRMTVARAVTQLEAYLERAVKSYDHSWAEEALERLAEEEERIDGYYEDLLRTAEPETKDAVQEQYERRRQEIDWQYRPRVRISVINCGLFHLAATEHAPNR